MQHRPLGRTGVSVSQFCLGTMMFGSWGNPDHDESIRIIHAALDAGINFIDTADVYGAGESEEIVGKALAGRRDHVVLATKFHNAMGEDPNQRGNSRRWIMRAVEGSLRRLGTDWIDLYQVHRPDPTAAVPLAMTSAGPCEGENLLLAQPLPAWPRRRRLASAYLAVTAPLILGAVHEGTGDGSFMVGFAWMATLPLSFAVMAADSAVELARGVPLADQGRWPGGAGGVRHRRPRQRVPAPGWPSGGAASTPASPSPPRLGLGLDRTTCPPLSSPGAPPGWPW